MADMDWLGIEGWFADTPEVIDGTAFIDIEPLYPDDNVPTCECDDPDVVKHGKRMVHFRDFPHQRQETYLRINRQRYRCRRCAENAICQRLNTGGKFACLFKRIFSGIDGRLSLRCLVFGVSFIRCKFAVGHFHFSFSLLINHSALSAQTFARSRHLRAMVIRLISGNRFIQRSQTGTEILLFTFALLDKR